MHHLKILHVIGTLAPRYGGPVTVVQALARHQALAGSDVTICTTNIDYPRGILDVPTNIPINDDGVINWYFSVDFRPLIVSRSLGRWLRNSLHRYDLVHIHGFYRFPSTYAAYLARTITVPYIIRPHGSLDPYLYNQRKIKGVPYVITPHGSLDPYLYVRSSVNLILKRLYERWFDFPNLHHASAIHYTAEDERQLASFLKLRAPSFVVPNGIDWTPFATLPERGAFRQTLGIGNEAPLVLFLGRLHHKKGLDLLIPAFQQIISQLPQARLAIVGPSNDNYGEQVRGWVRARGLDPAVDFVEFLSGTALIQAYVDSDVFVLPSYTENFGMTVVESMACGVPVVISRHVNIHREITAEDAGVVTECDADEVARATLELLNDPERRRRMGANGRKAAYRRYTWPRIVDLLTEEYQRIARQ